MSEDLDWEIDGVDGRTVAILTAAAGSAAAIPVIVWVAIVGGTAGGMAAMFASVGLLVGGLGTAFGLQGGPGVGATTLVVSLVMGLLVRHAWPSQLDDRKSDP